MDDDIEKGEKNLIGRNRKFAVGSLFVLTIGVPALIYFLAKNGEKRDFERRFDVSSDKVYDAFGTTMDMTLSAIDTFVVSMVSSAEDKGEVWPEVTVPDFAVRVAKIRALSQATIVAKYHLCTKEQRLDWEEYSRSNDGWINETFAVQRFDSTFADRMSAPYGRAAVIHGFGYTPRPNDTQLMMPKWQQAPIVPKPYLSPYNIDGLVFAQQLEALPVLVEKREAVIGRVINIVNEDVPGFGKDIVDGNNAYLKDYLAEGEDSTEPFSNLYFPIIDSAARVVSRDSDFQADGVKDLIEGDKVVGGMVLTFYWRSLLTKVLQDGSSATVVISNKCNQSFTYEVAGDKPMFIGPDEIYESKYEKRGLKKSLQLDELLSRATGFDQRIYTGVPLSTEGCAYTVTIYPAKSYEDVVITRRPKLYAGICLICLASMLLLFLIYDHIMIQRQRMIEQQAEQSDAILSSLFPASIRRKLYANSLYDTAQAPSKVRLLSYLRSDQSKSTKRAYTPAPRKPIADLFLEATVSIADVANFTSWASSRSPTQVLVLLEALYSSFDGVARRHGVFKVESVGDSYLSVTGVPEPREDHAVAMTVFACECLAKMSCVTRELEVSLGPDTADLQIRIGINSGPVTAGVIRGDKSRFQLFGDTVNTASRMESNGIPAQAQVSESTAKELQAHGKGFWIRQRDERIHMKGKGMCTTFLVNQSAVIGAPPPSNPGAGKLDRLIDWNTEILAQGIKLIAMRNKELSIYKGADKGSKRARRAESPKIEGQEVTTVFDEVTEILEMKKFNPKAKASTEEASNFELEPNVMAQLRDYVAKTASSYKDNPFHSFEHASHVCLSVSKILGRIVVPELEDTVGYGRASREALHNATFGITSDPLSQFACVFSALIHDAEHKGVPNATLVAEKDPLAIQYRNQSVAEQRSVDLSWDLFMTSDYDDLRTVICPNQKELTRFRKLVVNLVLATDIVDKELKQLRNARWMKAFSDPSVKEYAATASLSEASSNGTGLIIASAPERDDVNRKATVALEHIIQASDIAHTMQHWHVYQKWNERLFHEMYLAFVEGRSDTNPADFWYEGEIGFFDFYIIPLAKKLDECGVFGISSDELLNFAVSNREEWTRRGRDVVAMYVKKYSMEHEKDEPECKPVEA